jgi:uncharacterized membrane protein YqjE
MTHETYGRFSARGLIAETFSDLSDLIQKEVRLAKAEVSYAVGTSIRASVMMAIGGALGLVALNFLFWCAVFIIACFGLEVYWASFIVAGVLIVIAAGLFIAGRAQMSADELGLSRTVNQMREDIRTAKEQMK